MFHVKLLLLSQLATGLLIIEGVVDPHQGSAKQISRPALYVGAPLALGFELVSEREGREEHGIRPTRLWRYAPQRRRDDPPEAANLGLRRRADDTVDFPSDPELDGGARHRRGELTTHEVADDDQRATAS
jgi:hypothetical protein